MREVTIQDYIGPAVELTAEQVRKLPVGTKLVLHSFGRKGEHQMLDMTVVQSGKKKALVAYDFYSGTKIEKPIRTATDRFCYTKEG